jgi:peptidyl-prolyl cis-trans isomerase D
MLRQLRSAEKMKRILWIGLLILIIPSMVAFYGFGTGDLGGGLHKSGDAATITYPDGSEGKISSTELRFAKNYLDNRLMRYSQDQGIALDSLAVSELTDSRALLDQAVNLDILRHYADTHGLTVGADEVMKTFQESTTADQRRQFVEQLRAQGQSLDNVLEEERKGRVLQKAADAIGEQVRVTHYEAWQEYEQQKETIVADFVKFNPTDYLTSVSVTTEGLNKYFEENQEKFRIPDQVVYEYVLLRKDDLKSSITVTNDEITSYYNAHKEDFRLPRKVQASQIFLKVPTPDEMNTTSPAAITSATLAITKKANDLYERAAKGEDFAQLASTFTEEQNFPPRADAGTTASDTQTTAGGNLGLISKDVAQTWYGDQWTSAVFSLEPGGITRPIRTPQGYAIVQVKSFIEGELQPMDEVRPVIENKIRDEKVEPIFEQAGARMQDVATNVSGSLEKISAATSATVSTSPKVNVGERFIPGIGLLGDFQEPIADLEKGIASDVLSDTQRHLVVQVKEEFPTHIPTLEEAKGRVEQAYKMQLAEDKAREKAEQLLTKSTDFNSFKQAVLDASTTFTHTRPFTRPEVSTVFGGPITDFARKTAGLKKDTIHLSEVGRPGQQTSYVVWYAAQVTEPSKTEFAKELSTITDRLTERKREIMVLDYIRDIRQKLEGSISVDESYM